MIKKLWEILIESKEESLVGLCVGLAYMGILNWTILVVPGLVMVLWRLGGYTGWSKLWRRIGVPAVICLGMALGSWSWLPFLAFFPAWAMVANGYGIPSFNGPGGSQDSGGSPIGKFVWYVILRQGKEKNEKIAPVADILTRGIYGFLIALAFIPAAFIPGTVMAYILGSMIITIGIPTIVVLVD